MVPSHTGKTPGILSTAGTYWNEHRLQDGILTATKKLASALWEFARDSTPDRLKARFGDADYDWDHRVNTTSGAVGWKERLLGQFYSAYQPTGPAYFVDMMEELKRHTNDDLSKFTFIDFGSGKGRALLMASDYPFRRIIGVELLPSLSQIARDNIARYKNDSQKCFALESVCANAADFHIPEGPLILYFFNPFLEPGLRRTLATLQKDVAHSAGPAYLLYHNPVLEHVLESQPFLNKITCTSQYSLYEVLTGR